MIDIPLGRWDRLLLRMVDAFEVLVKYLAAIALSDILGRTVPAPLRSMLVATLERPSLGHWAGYLRAAVESLAGDAQRAYMPEILDYHDQVLSKRIDDFVTLRNDLKHGGLPEDDVCAVIFADKFPAFVQLLVPAAFLSRYLLVGIEGRTPVIGTRPAAVPVAPPHGGRPGRRRGHLAGPRRARSAAAVAAGRVSRVPVPAQAESLPGAVVPVLQRPQEQEGSHPARLPPGPLGPRPGNPGRLHTPRAAGRLAARHDGSLREPDRREDPRIPGPL